MILKERHNDHPLVSVCVQTYQHADYIKDCLDSILMQKTTFSFEIVLGEDESTDGTRDVCIEYSKKYPNIIRLFLNCRKNVIYVNGLPTGRWNLINNLFNARGKYIALLEGDDYWTDYSKLQKQVDILEQNKDIIACHHWHEYKYVDEQKGKGTPKHGYYPEKVATVRDIFANRLRVKSRTIMFRNIINKDFFPNWFKKVAYGDVPLSFLLGKYGNFYFIDEPMAVYRITGKGISTSGNSLVHTGLWYKEHFFNWIDVWNYANKHYNYMYNKEAVATIAEFCRIILRTNNYSWKTFLEISLKIISKNKDYIVNQIHILKLLSNYNLKKRFAKSW